MDNLYDNGIINIERIYRPKFKRLCPKATKSTMPYKSNISINKTSKKYLNNSKIEEINHDFLQLNQNRENEKCKNELINIIKNKFLLDDNSLDNNYIKRSENPFEKNIELLGEKNVLKKIKEITDLINIFGF